MASADTSPLATTEETIASAVAPPRAARPRGEHAESTDDTSVSSKDSSITPARFVLTEKELDDAFNDIWANNANAISHCYSNTDALKVDFTRTGKRSFLGMINDATNSVYRMVQGAVTDFFRQTIIDFTYGSIGLQGLERYYDDLSSRDPSESIRLARVRSSAIESCRREAVPASEPVIGGWTLCSPLQTNTVQALKLEEKVAILTAKALYVCSYDFGSEMLNAFTKVLVGDIIGIQKGLYVISPHESSHPDDYWGIVVTYLNSVSRSNTTASIKNMTTTSGAAATATDAHSSGSVLRIFAFRAISDELEDAKSDAKSAPRSRHLHHTVIGDRSDSQQGDKRSSDSRDELDIGEDDGEGGIVSSKKKVAMIVGMLRECCIDAGAFDPDNEDEEKPFVTHKTIQRYVLD
uniref:HSac2 domain-containing protein n=1 Tax=Melanopsichium pennsylvanicum 4 TaxID=1398559 RepID=A0A077R3J0_9BASI|nr:conserved hypothetical protein [Melanopsichium pennsylvanicum 4]